MQKLDDRIRCALRRSAERCGSVLALSRLLGVSHSTVLFWLNGRIRNISTDLWLQKVFPVLEEDLCLLAEKELTPGQIRCFYQADGFSCTGRGFTQIHLMKEQDLLSYRMPLEGISSFAKRCGVKTNIPDISPMSVQRCYSVQLDHVLDHTVPGWSALVIFTEQSALSDYDLVLLRIRSESSLRICRFRSAKGEYFFEDIVSRRVVIRCRDEKEDDLFRVLWTFPVISIRFCSRTRGAFFNTLWSP